MANLKLFSGPTWGPASPTRTLGALKTDREVAARADPALANLMLGSIWWKDDFEGRCLTWGSYSGVTEGRIDLSSVYAYTGSQSVYLETSADDTDISSITRVFITPLRPTIGLGFYFMPVTNQGIIECMMIAQCDGVMGVAGVQYSAGSGELKYRSDAGAWVLLDTLAWPAATAYHWAWLQCVVDIETATYKRIWFGSNLYELSADLAPLGSWGFEDALSVTIQTVNDGGDVSIYCVDDVILTRDEY